MYRDGIGASGRARGEREEGTKNEYAKLLLLENVVPQAVQKAEHAGHCLQQELQR